MLPLLMLGAAAILFLALGGGHYLTFPALAENRQLLTQLAARSNVAAALCFIAVYAGLAALSIPGAAVLSIAAGMLFGIWLGTLYAVVGATLGATAIFAAARAGFGNITERAHSQVRRLEGGFRTDAFNYLLVLRLIPIFPFWLVNLVAALARVRFQTYVVGTFLGIIPGTFVFVSLGKGFGDIVAAGRSPDLGIVFRPSVLLPLCGLAALALMPMVYRRWRL
jgi:uncharacterized membrane protein YdjX (TVP38/TMEM64 family)